VTQSSQNGKEANIIDKLHFSLLGSNQTVPNTKYSEPAPATPEICFPNACNALGP